MAEWVRVTNTTIKNFYRKEEVNIMRNRKLTALLREHGRVRYNMGGHQVEQRVRYRRAPMVAYADMDVVQFARQNRWKLANLGWRGYSIADMVSKRERKINKGEQAIINLMGGIGKQLKEDLEDQFHEELYVDGNAAGQTKQIHGLESIFAVGGSATVADGYESPNDTYAGLSTALGNYSGSWTGSWPDGTGDSHYDFWSPVIIDITDTSSPWSDGSTWAANAKQVTRRGIIKAERNGGRNNQIDLILTTDTMYAEYLDLIDDIERILVNRGERSSKLTQIGFRNVINQDGVDVTWEYGMTADAAYGLSFNSMELRSLDDQLFDADGPEYDVGTKTWRMSCDFLGNLFTNPRNLVKWAKYGT